VVALTIYACTTDTDFTTSMGLVLVLVVCLMILGITSMFVNSPFLTNLYCCVGVLVFGLYLVIDTQLIMGGKTNNLAIDQYILAAMLLYIDIIQIFLYILRILGKK
jgi:FtsH-binding integral membrane protein